MKERKITLTLDNARELYNSNNETLKKIALQVFDESELKNDFRSIKSFKDACDVLELDYEEVIIETYYVGKISKASAAMFKLNIIRKALNLGQDLHLTKNPKDSYIYYPSLQLISEGSESGEKERNLGKMEVIGKIKSEGEEYCVFGGCAYNSYDKGLGTFLPDYKVGLAYPSVGFLGCASQEIAQHFGKYFGMLIVEAEYGDMIDFEIISKHYID